MSPDVTEPNSFPSSPTRAENVSDTCSSFSAIPLLLNALQIARGRFVRQTVRQQVIPRIARLHLHDIAWRTEILDCLAENDFHVWLRSV